MKRISLTAWIFIGMAAGVALGILAPDFAKQLGLVSTVFLRLIRSIIAPRCSDGPSAPDSSRPIGPFSSMNENGASEAPNATQDSRLSFLRRDVHGH